MIKLTTTTWGEFDGHKPNKVLVYRLKTDILTSSGFNKVYIKETNKKHIDASVKERPQTLPVPSEEICKRVLCNKHI